MSRFDSELLERARTAVNRALQGLGKPTAPEPPARPTTVLEIAIELCKRFEGLRLRPYLCPASVPSIGYGATHYRDGTRVTLKDPPITAEEAFALLLWHLENVYLPAVVRQCPAIITQPARRIAAVLDWTFNLGETRLRTSTLRKCINRDEWDRVPIEIRKWILAGGVRQPGLVLRRDEEAKLI